jgi:hypothetical protein
MPMQKGCLYQGVLYQGRGDADTKSEGMPIPRARGCRYEERKDANVEECDTEGAGMQIPRRAMRILRESDTNAEGEQCQSRMLPGDEAYNSTTISMTG